MFHSYVIDVIARTNKQAYTEVSPLLPSCLGVPYL